MLSILIFILPRIKAILTKCAAVWSTAEKVVLKLEVLVENRRVELHFAIELITNSFPVCSRLGHDLT